MLERKLPRLQARYGDHAVRILAETQVLEVRHSGSNGSRRATGVRARMSDGRTIDVHADTVVVAAGALPVDSGERVRRRRAAGLRLTPAQRRSAATS